MADVGSRNPEQLLGAFEGFPAQRGHIGPGQRLDAVDLFGIEYRGMDNDWPVELHHYF